MSTVFAKLNFKEYKQIVVLDSPGSFESELAALKGVEIIRDLKKPKEVTFSLAFVTTPEQINALAPAIARKSGETLSYGSPIPRGPRRNTSRRLTGTTAGIYLATKGLSPSAKRFRRAGFIKNMTRPKEYRLTEPAESLRRSLW